MEARVRFPVPLSPGASLGVTAFSSGVASHLHPRLDLILESLKTRGYQIREGQNLRRNIKAASATSAARGTELAAFLQDPTLCAVLPPWGGEFAIQTLPYIDFDRLRSLPPKWVCGFSDVSTLCVPLTLRAGWATMHSSSLMDWTPRQTDQLTRGIFEVLEGRANQAPFVQQESPHWQLSYRNLVRHPDAPFRLTEATRWRVLGNATAPVHMRGRLIGGCLDTLRHLVGTPFADIPTYIADNQLHGDGTIVFLENSDLDAFDVARTFAGMRLAGWFTGISGLLVGRSSGPDAKTAEEYAYREALDDALGGLSCPVLYDCDIGHRQPQLVLVNGARADVSYDDAAPAGQRATVTQYLES